MMTYEPMKGLQEKYPDKYFQVRDEGNRERQIQYAQESKLVKKYLKAGRIMDVGCAGGEFLEALQWDGEKYGMEISPYARSLAESKGVRFDRSIFDTEDFFDGVVFRGSIQNVDEPFRFIKFANRSLKSGGFLIFLSTPNGRSPIFRLKKRFPFVKPEYSFYIPDDVTLPNALKNMGFKTLEIRYPYWESPYRNLIRDHYFFFLNLISTRFYPHAFWKSMIEIVAKKERTI